MYRAISVPSVTGHARRGKTVRLGASGASSDAAVRVGQVLAGFLRTETRTLGSVQEIC